MVYGAMVVDVIGAGMMVVVVMRNEVKVFV